MELSLKSKTIKKRSKKKKIRFPENAVVPLIKPDAIDGISNWVRMQKIIGSVKEKKPEKQVLEKMLEMASFDEKSKAYKPPFSKNSNYNSKNSSQSSREKYMQKNITENDNDKSLSKTSSIKSEQPEDEKSQNQPYTFNFNESTDNSPSKNSSYEVRRNKYNEKKLTKAVAMDCEMVGTGPNGEESIIARVSLVNSFGVCLYDEFVKPKEKVTDYRTRISGVRPSDLKKGKDLFEVQNDVLKIIEGRILVGHAIKHDLDVLFLSHPRHLIRDTAFYKPFRELCGGKTPSLKKLTSKILGCDIQGGEHSSVEDAQATMLLYLRQREEWETEVEDAQAAMLLYLRMKKEWEKEIRCHRKRKPKIIENQINN